MANEKHVAILRRGVEDSYVRLIRQVRERVYGEVMDRRGGSRC